MGCFHSSCGSCMKPPKIAIPEDPTKNVGNGFSTFFNVLNHPSYLFEFDTRRTIRFDPDQKVEFSNFALNGLASSYRTIADSKKTFCGHNFADCYIACPVYADPKTGKIQDTQLAVTGTCYKDEDYLKAITRELSEEIGIVAQEQNVVKISSMTGQKRTEVSYIVNISGAKCFNSRIDSVSTGTDDKTKKVQIVVYGSIGDLLKLYTTVSERPDSDDLLTIKYVRFVSLKEFF